MAVTLRVIGTLPVASLTDVQAEGEASLSHSYTALVPSVSSCCKGNKDANSPMVPVLSVDTAAMSPASPWRQTHTPVCFTCEFKRSLINLTSNGRNEITKLAKHLSQLTNLYPLCLDVLLRIHLQHHRSLSTPRE